MEICLLRHGTTAWNAEHRIQGNVDTELDPVGLEMARITGERLRELGIRFDLVFSSPLSRAYRTAQLVSGVEGEGKIILDDRLRELNFGRQEGRIVEEMTVDPASPFRFFKTDPPEYDRQIRERKEEMQAESLTELCERTAAFLKERIESLPADGRVDISGNGEERKPVSRILISAHGACNKALIMHIRGDGELSDFWKNGLQPNCGMDLIDYDPERKTWQIRESNRIFYPEDLRDRFRSLL